MRDENKKRFTETPGNRLIHSQKKKNFERPPRELQCSDRAQTSTTGSGRASCIDVVLGFWLKVLVRRDMFENRRKNHNYTYTYLELHCSPQLLSSLCRDISEVNYHPSLGACAVCHACICAVCMINLPHGTKMAAVRSFAPKVATYV